MTPPPNACKCQSSAMFTEKCNVAGSLIVPYVCRTLHTLADTVPHASRWQDWPANMQQNTGAHQRSAPIAARHN